MVCDIYSCPTVTYLEIIFLALTSIFCFCLNSFLAILRKESIYFSEQFDCIALAKLCMLCKGQKTVFFHFYNGIIEAVWFNLNSEQ